MSDIYDVIIIGGGPAGCSAALTLRSRGKKVLIVSNGIEQSGLYKAKNIDNYPGIPAVSGAALSKKIRDHAEEMGAEIMPGRVISAMQSGDNFLVAVGTDIKSSSSLIIATGIVQKNAYPGESELLGRGVSYCATCDGMLYRGKKVAVLGFSADSVHEADFLREIGCEVEFFDKKRARKYEILGDDKVETLIADGTKYHVDGIFILRDTVSVDALMPGLDTDNNGIITSRDMSTSIPGVFAAGDCAGKPHQLAKAVGDGNVAALSAAEYLDTKER